MKVYILRQKQCEAHNCKIWASKAPLYAPTGLAVAKLQICDTQLQRQSLP